MVVEEIHTAAATNKLDITPVVINDCSADKTETITSSLNCVAINLPVNLGIGGAVQTGYKYAFENGYDYVVQVDGDGQHPANFIGELYKEMLKKNLDVVIGSRYLIKSGFQSSAMRRIGINYFRWLNRLLTGLNISDSTSGFRILNKKALNLLLEIYPDEYPEPEALILYYKLKLNIGEYPVQMRERQGGRSSINAFSSVYYMFKVSIAIIFTRIRKIK